MIQTLNKEAGESSGWEIKTVPLDVTDMSAIRDTIRSSVLDSITASFSASKTRLEESGIRGRM